MIDKRLTKHWGDNFVATELNCDFLFSLSEKETENFNAIIKKLAYYEDLEEQGRLVVSSCKTDDVATLDRKEDEEYPFYTSNVEKEIGYCCINCGEFVSVADKYCHNCFEGFDN